MDQEMLQLHWKIGASHPQWLLWYLRNLPPGVLSSLRRSAFRRTLRWAASRSSFYRQRFLDHGVDVAKVNVPEELGSFFLSPEEIREVPEKLVCAKPDLAIESSGTTGHATRVFLSQRELDYNARQGVLLKAVYGISPEDRILSTFDYGFCMDGLMAQKGLPYWKVFGMCVGRVDPVDVYRRLPSYRFNVVMSGTPWLARFTELAQAEGRPYPLKLLIGGGGGGISKKTRAWIEAFWQAPVCVTYGLTEAATTLGFECLRRDGYHLNEFDFFVEILNPDDEGYGEVVVTAVNRHVMPLLRYRTRDVARIVEDACPCGLPFRRLSPLRGRIDEIVASVWGNVHPDFFEKILDPIQEIGEEWQVALQERNGKQTFEFRLELKNGAAPREQVRQGVLDAVRQRHALAWQACEQGLADVTFVFYPKGTLRKGRKLLRLVDEREKASR